MIVLWMIVSYIKTYYWFKYSGLAAIDWILSSKSGAVWQDHPELKVPAQAQCRTLFTVFVWQIHIKCKIIVQHICIGVQPELYRLHKRLWYCFVLSCYRLRIILGWTSDRKFKNNCWPSKGTHPGKKNVFFRALPDLPPPLPLRLGDDHP